MNKLWTKEEELDLKKGFEDGLTDEQLAIRHSRTAKAIGARRVKIGISKLHRLNYTDKQLVQATKQSISIRQTLIVLGIVPAGGNYATIKKHIERLNLDTSHFLGQAQNKGKTLQPKRPIEDYLSNRHSIQSHPLRLRLIKEGYFTHKCYRCNLTTWQGRPIPIELEHKDGNHHNNRLENLTILCPNCHALTPTYRGKNISKEVDIC